MSSLLHMFVRELVQEIRRMADEAEMPGATPRGTGEVLRGVAAAIEATAKRTLLT
jgi:hypothetical protein